MSQFDFIGLFCRLVYLAGLYSAADLPPDSAGPRFGFNIFFSMLYLLTFFSGFPFTFALVFYPF